MPDEIGHPYTVATLEERTREEIEAAVALAQARTGRPYDPWDWFPITDDDVTRAVALVKVLAVQREVQDRLPRPAKVR